MEKLILSNEYVNDLEIEKFAGMIKDNTQCYKFYWLESLINLLAEGKKEITYLEAVSEMIVLSWYTVTYYHLSMGSNLADIGQENALEKTIKTLLKVSDLDENSEKSEIVRAITENCDYDQLKKCLQSLVKYVPYRALNYFGTDLTGNDKRWNSTKRIIFYFNELNKIRPLPYYFKEGTGWNGFIIWNDIWAAMIMDNLPIIKDWINYNKVLYLQKRNPGVPGIVYKLDRAKLRKLNEVRKLWKTIMEECEVRDIYNPSLILNNRSYDVDHFIPWSYVASDELWNLCPVDASLNRQKSNSLPTWEEHFSAFSANQLLIRNKIPANSKVQKAFDQCRKDNLNALWSQNLYNVQSDDEFKKLLEENIYPIYRSAKAQGFTIWSGPIL